jgi:hypothetical protein
VVLKLTRGTTHPMTLVLYPVSRLPVAHYPTQPDFFITVDVALLRIFFKFALAFGVPLTTLLV